jgi:hypothetical protein
MLIFKFTKKSKKKFKFFLIIKLGIINKLLKEGRRKKRSKKVFILKVRKIIIKNYKLLEEGLRAACNK